ncbi:MAG TPA: GMC family oxidoreductase [Polyangia bacterium]|nr:GMC family oxidoreductase [Polyangia bacterium]
MVAPIEDAVFDVVIVGSGFGGASAAYTLSQAGLRTLLVERGGAVNRDDQDWNGRAILVDGRYRGDTPVLVRQEGAKDATPMFNNEVVGGNSIFFGGASLRLRAADFASWPISYAILEPFYGQAESLLEVHGNAGEDPCEPPRSAEYPFPLPELTDPARRIYEAAKKIGLHPFRLPLAINHQGSRRPRCLNCFTCDGFPCKIGAKNDVTTTLLLKARQDCLTVLPRVLATRLVHRDGRVSALEAVERDSGRRLSLKAKAFVVSGGAIGTPALLLRSGLEALDRSQSIGRFLMRHCNGMIGFVFPFRTNPKAVNHKQVGISDLYEARRPVDGKAVGIIQDMCMPPPDVVRLKGPRGFRWAAALVASSIQTLICIAEDEAQRENRVFLSSSDLDRWDLPLTIVEHSYSAADKARRALLVRTAKRILRAAGGVIGKVDMIRSFSHAVGTVRFGASAEAAPLDVNCRLHGVANLFVVDGSFMPSSGGVNPSLTIAANALRVAGHVRDGFGAIAA